MMKLSASLAVCTVLSGCVAAPEPQGSYSASNGYARKQGLQAAFAGAAQPAEEEDKAYAPEAESAAEPLQFGVLPPAGYRYEHLVMLGSNTKFSDEEMADFIIQQLGTSLPAAKVRSVSESEGSDVLLRINVAGCGFSCSGSVEAISAVSKRMVSRFSFSGWPNLVNQVNGAFAPGRPAYKLILNQRLESQKRETSEKGLSREDMAIIVKAAVSGAQEAKAAEQPKSISSDIDRPAYKLAERPNDFALVVGIGKYSDLPEAQFAERDAEAVKEHLIAEGFPSRNVIQLFGEKAGRSALEKFIETWLPRNVGENSRVFFYFSGHGAPDPRTGEAYLLPWDADPGFLENTGYPTKRLYARLGALKAKEVIVAMDACFSGAGGRSVLAKGARPLVTKVDTGSVPRNLTVFAAASGDQITSTLEDQGHGTFTYYFLKGLAGAAKDESGAVTAKGLYGYLKPKVQDAARRQNREQAPVLSAQEDRKLVRF